MATASGTARELLTSESEAPARTWPAGRMLLLWVVLVMALESLQWLSGVRMTSLAEAVELGAARAESRLSGEVSDGVIRQAIRDQRETLAFWRNMALITDFIVEPLFLVVRALGAATLLSALAALVGRTIGFGQAVRECAAWQGIWVLGLAVSVGLAVVLGVPEGGTSLAIALEPGTYSAWYWVSLRQVDAFSLWGWAMLAWSGWRRGQANLAVSVAACALLACVEAVFRVLPTLICGAAMRLSLLPEWL